MKVNCPRCEQDWVLKAKVKKTGETLFICPECEAAWFSEDRITYATFHYFNYSMERQALGNDWSELDVLHAAKSFPHSGTDGSEGQREGRIE